MVGAVVSFLVLGTLFAYLVYKIQILYTKSDTKLSKKSFFLDLDVSEIDINVGEEGFDFAFGLFSDLDRRHGYFDL